MKFAFGDGNQASPPIGATGDVEQVLAAVSDTPLTDGDDVIDVLGLAGWWAVPEISTPWWYITRPDQMHTVRLIIENRSTEKMGPTRLVIAREYFRLRVISFGFSRTSWTRDGARIPLGPGYQVPLASKVRQEAGFVIRAVGLIADPHQAEGVLARGEADQIALARAFLDNPRWGWHAAEALGVDLPYPPQYARSRAAVWPGARIARPGEDVAPERLRA